MKILVTDADDKKALAAIRSLGRRGVEVTAAGADGWGQGLHSKYAAHKVIYPNPAKQFEEWAGFMIEYLSRVKVDCVLSMSDYTSLALSKHLGEFEKYTAVPVPAYDVAVRTRDKLEMVRLAERLGIGAPKTWCPQSIEEAEDLSGRIEYPVVVKYRRGTGAIGVKYAHSREEFAEIYRPRPHRPDAVFEDTAPLVQEYIEGEIHDVCVLCRHGEPRAALTQVRAEMWPPSGGRGVRDITTDEPELKEAGLRLCREVKWHGPGQVEFKIDRRDGQAKLMEINGRFWGALGAATEAGMDFAYLAAKMAVEGDVEVAFDYKVGAVYRWPFPYQWENVWTSKRRWEALKDFVKIEKGTKCDLWPSDPMPHAVSIARGAYLGLRRRLG